MIAIIPKGIGLAEAVRAWVRIRYPKVKEDSLTAITALRIRHSRNVDFAAIHSLHASTGFTIGFSKKDMTVSEARRLTMLGISLYLKSREAEINELHVEQFQTRVIRYEPTWY